ncbi:hypothetical protein ACDX78_02340 [Virgibacillus oceani]
MYRVWKHTEDELGPYTIEYGTVSEDALNLILDAATEHENVEFEEVK